MNRPRTIHYRIERGNMTPAQVECVEWAIREWKSAMHGWLAITEDHAFADWQFSFSQHPNYPAKTGGSAGGGESTVRDVRYRWRSLRGPFLHESKLTSRDGVTLFE